MKNDSTEKDLVLDKLDKEDKGPIVYTNLFGGMTMYESELLSLLASRDQWDN